MNMGVSLFTSRRIILITSAAFSFAESAARLCIWVIVSRRILSIWSSFTIAITAPPFCRRHVKYIVKSPFEAHARDNQTLWRSGTQLWPDSSDDICFAGQRLGGGQLNPHRDVGAVFPQQPQTVTLPGTHLPDNRGGRVLVPQLLVPCPQRCGHEKPDVGAPDFPSVTGQALGLGVDYHDCPVAAHNQQGVRRVPEQSYAQVQLVHCVLELIARHHTGSGKERRDRLRRVADHVGDLLINIRLWHSPSLQAYADAAPVAYVLGTR